MSAPDPARTPKRTKVETLKMYQSGCRSIACETIKSGILSCPFCPWIKKYYLLEEP